MKLKRHWDLTKANEGNEGNCTRWVATLLTLISPASVGIPSVESSCFF